MRNYLFTLIGAFITISLIVLAGYEPASVTKEQDTYVKSTDGDSISQNIPQKEIGRLPKVPNVYPAIKIPAAMSFAGESVPLNDFEVKERLDRELLVNSYWHSNTLQNLKLANRWFPLIEKILVKEGVPTDFKYLAVAESGLRNVISPAKATGVWQFLKSTALYYGLKINSEVDERYDVEKSTEAACKYLNEAHEKFGNWTLAAASYNMGMESVENRLEDQQVSTYYDLYLNSETSRYIFRIVAFKLIYENHERYGFILDDEDVYQPLQFYTLEVNSSIGNLASFAKENGTTYKMLKYLNPWLREDRLTAGDGKSYLIKLPK